MHNIGKVSVNAHVTKPTGENFSSFRYFFYEKTVKMHSTFLCSLFENDNTHQAEIFQGKLSTIVIPCYV